MGESGIYRNGLTSWNKTKTGEQNAMSNDQLWEQKSFVGGALVGSGRARVNAFRCWASPCLVGLALFFNTKTVVKGHYFVNLGFRDSANEIWDPNVVFEKPRSRNSGFRSSYAE
jgi:hypothetical protein